MGNPRGITIIRQRGPAGLPFSGTAGGFPPTGVPPSPPRSTKIFYIPADRGEVWKTPGGPPRGDTFLFVCSFPGARAPDGRTYSPNARPFSPSYHAPFERGDPGGPRPNREFSPRSYKSPAAKKKPRSWVPIFQSGPDVSTRIPRGMGWAENREKGYIIPRHGKFSLGRDMFWGKELKNFQRDHAGCSTPPGRFWGPGGKSWAMTRRGSPCPDSLKKILGPPIPGGGRTLQQLNRKISKNPPGKRGPSPMWE